MTVTCPACGHKHILNPRRRQRHSNLTHKAIGYVAGELGMDPAELKVELKLRTGSWAAWPMERLPEWSGKFVADTWVLDITGHPAVFLKSESDYDTEEEALLLQVTKAYANANHIDLSWMEE